MNKLSKLKLDKLKNWNLKLIYLRSSFNITKKYGKFKISAKNKKLRRERKKSFKKEKLDNLKKKKEGNHSKLLHLQVHLLLLKLPVVLHLKNHWLL
jgi:hypothetical protein